MIKFNATAGTVTLLLGAIAFVGMPAAADHVILDDCIIDGSMCVGLDCVNGESFGSDTIRVKENNVRFHFLDTSNSASFPPNDWRLTANDSTNGGANHFSIEDASAGRFLFRVFAGAPANSMVIDSQGEWGQGTTTPVVEIEVKDGNTPTLRLQQDGTSGFSPQTWDVAGNEAGFFIRDATNGSTLPFRIGLSAPSESLTIEQNTGDIGVGTFSPDSNMHILYNDAADGLHIETTDTAGTTQLLSLESGARPRLEMVNNSVPSVWNFDVLNGTGNFAFINTGGPVFSFETDGDLVVPGEVYSATCVAQTMPCAPDYVFEDDYDLLPLDEVEAFIDENGHLPNVPSAEELVGPISVSKMQMKLLEKIEELTLYTLQQHETIAALEARLAALETPEGEVSEQ